MNDMVSLDEPTRRHPWFRTGESVRMSDGAFWVIPHPVIRIETQADVSRPGGVQLWPWLDWGDEDVNAAYARFWGEYLERLKTLEEPIALVLAAARGVQAADVTKLDPEKVESGLRAHDANRDGPAPGHSGNRGAPPRRSNTT